MTNYKKKTATVKQPFTHKGEFYPVTKNGKPVKFTAKKSVIDAFKQLNLIE